MNESWLTARGYRYVSIVQRWDTVIMICSEGHLYSDRASLNTFRVVPILANHANWYQKSRQLNLAGWWLLASFAFAVIKTRVNVFFCHESFSPTIITLAPFVKTPGISLNHRSKQYMPSSPIQQGLGAFSYWQGCMTRDHTVNKPGWEHVHHGLPDN